MSSSVQQAKVYDVAGVKDRFGGLGPEAVADIKALQGDSSDNIPGVPGVGVKTAVNLVSKFGDIEQIIAHIDEVTPPRAQKNIREGVEQLRESKVLTTIVKDAPVTLDLECDPLLAVRPVEGRGLPNRARVLKRCAAYSGTGGRSGRG